MRHTHTQTRMGTKKKKKKDKQRMLGDSNSLPIIYSGFSEMRQVHARRHFFVSQTWKQIHIHDQDNGPASQTVHKTKH